MTTDDKKENKAQPVEAKGASKDKQSSPSAEESQKSELSVNSKIEAEKAVASGGSQAKAEEKSVNSDEKSSPSESKEESQLAKSDSSESKEKASPAKSSPSESKEKASLAKSDSSESKEESQLAKSSPSESKEESQLAKSDSSESKEKVSPAKSSPSEPKNEKNQLVESNSSEPKEKTRSTADDPKKENKGGIKLNGLFAFKMSMSHFYNEKGESIPVTALKYEPCFVSQIKSKEKESYSAVQVAFKAQKNKRCSKALIKHLAPAGFKEGARFVKEIRQEPPEGVKLGQELSIDSLQKGDLVKISALSKGRGFAGVMKRWNFRGGKASHGSKSHRRTGSIGQHTEPARVFPGRKMPGRYGFQKHSRSKVPVVDVLAEEGIIFIKGPVPGARNTLVSIQKM